MSPFDLTPYQLLFVIGVFVIIPIAIYLALSKKAVESFVLAAAMSTGFGAFTAVTIWAEGVMPVIENHTVNLWGVQVWYDLLISVTIALLFVVPRARKANMIVPLWVLFVASTASIGLLAMVARLFWLEQSNAANTPDAFTE